MLSNTIQTQLNQNKNWKKKKPHHFNTNIFLNLCEDGSYNYVKSQETIMQPIASLLLA